MEADAASDVQARVAAGAAWLDEHKPDWVQAFADDEAAGLEMRSCSRCVLGHVDGWYYRSSLFTDLQESDGYVPLDRGEIVREVIARATPLGFTAVPPPGETYNAKLAPGEVERGWDDWAALTDAWRALIQRRLRAAV